MRRWLCGLLGGLLLVTPLGAAAQELTIDELVNVALAQSPVLRATRTDVAMAHGQLDEAGRHRNPMVGASRQEMVDGPGNQTMVEVQWPLDLFRRGARVASAERAVELTTLSIADAERLLAASVRDQAGRVLEARRDLRILQDLLAVDRQLRDLLEARVREGAAPRLDLDILQVQVERTEAQEALQLAEVEASLIDLRALAGEPPESTTTLAGSLEDVVGAMDASSRDVAVPEVVERRADVLASVAKARLADTQIEQLRREGWADATVFGEYGRLNMGFPQQGFDTNGTLAPIRGLFNNVRVGVMVSVPIWDRNQGRVAAASASRERAEHELLASRLAAGAEIAVADARERAARRAVQLYATGAREQARRNLDVVREAYELGRTSLVDVLDEQRRYLEVENAYTQALSAAYRARTALRRATGDVK